MDESHVSWRSYGPSPSDLGSIWSAFDAIRHIRYGPDWNESVVTPQTQVLTDISTGALPSMSWVTPDFRSSDHETYGIGGQHQAERTDLGPQWVATVVNAIGRSSYWNDTAVVVIWDDWGGWYDHVRPPQLDAMGLGFRVPANCFRRRSVELPGAADVGAVRRRSAFRDGGALRSALNEGHRSLAAL